MNVKSLLESEVKVINLGLEGFADSLREQSIPVVHVRWRPPAMGDDSLLNLLDKLR